MLHGAGAAVNMDFLFGLPHQTPESFADSIRRAIDTRPERLVTFSYGHMPQVFKRQQVLEKHGLPAANAKRRMHDLAAELLQQAYPNLVIAGNLRDGIGMGDRIRQACDIAERYGV